MSTDLFRSVTNVIFFLLTTILLFIILMTGIAIFLNEFDPFLLKVIITLLTFEVELFCFKRIALDLSSNEPISETVAKDFQIISRCLFLQGAVWLIINIAMNGGLVLTISFPEKYFGTEPFIILYFSLFFSAMSSLFAKISTAEDKYVTDVNGSCQ